MRGAELPPSKEVEATKEPAPAELFTVDFCIMDYYHRVQQSIKGPHDLVLDTTLHRDWIFEGFIETPYGNFLVDCEMDEARRALADIKQYVESKKKLEEVTAEHATAMREHGNCAERWRRNDNRETEAALSEVLLREHKASEQKSLLAYMIKIQQEKVQKYKV